MTRRLQPVAAVGLAPLAALHRMCFPQDPWDARTLAEVLGLPGTFGWIACEDDEPTGFVLGLLAGGECEILSLGVRPQRRREGIGLFLLDAACARAQRHRAGRVVLEVAVDNEGARALYHKRGFAPVGKRPAYYQRSTPPADALVLALTLMPPAST